MDITRPIYEEYIGPVGNKDGFVHEFCWENIPPSGINAQAGDVIEWCVERFGEGGRNERWASFGNATIICFRHQRDAFEFKLRWVG